MSPSAPRDEARRRTVVRIAEVDPLARLRRHRKRRDHRIGAIFGQRLQQGIEAAQLDRALELQLLADQPRELDVEARRIAVRPPHS